MELSKYINRFVKIDICISPSFYMDLSNMIYGFLFCYHRFVEVVLCQTKASLTKISKLVEASAFNYCLECVKLLNVVGSLCLWQ